MPRMRLLNTIYHSRKINAKSYETRFPYCLILTSSQRKLREYIEFLKFDVMLKDIEKFKFV